MYPNQRECNRKMKETPEPFVGNVACGAEHNQIFRKEYWSGECAQMTLMCIPCGEDIGMEMHCKTDQMIRVEEGNGTVYMGSCKEKMNFQACLCQNDVVFVPKGTWHNIINTGNCPLKLSSIYAPPEHKKGTIHKTKAEAQRAEKIH